MLLAVQTTSRIISMLNIANSGEIMLAMWDQAHKMAPDYSEHNGNSFLTVSQILME